MTPPEHGDQATGPDEPVRGPNRPGRLRRAALATGLAAVGVAAAVVAERAAIRRLRSAGDPERGERLSERPGTERRVVSFDGTELAVNVTGPDGVAPAGNHRPQAARPTLVFVHGFSQNLAGWHFQWTRFARDHRCVLYDQRGHGRSGAAAGGDYSLDALGRDVLGVIDAVAPDDPVALIGHSMGGMAIVSFASLHPAEFGRRVGAVVLSDTAAGDLIQQALGGLASRLGRVYLPSVRLLGRRPGIARRARATAFRGRSDLAFLIARATNFGPGASASVIDHVVRMSATTPSEVWTDLAVSMIEMDLAGALEHVTVPTLVVVGELDRMTPVSSARVLAERLPQGRLEVIAGAGHAAPLERHEDWNRVVAAFLDEVGGFARTAGRTPKARA